VNRLTLIPSHCELCSSGLYRRKYATVETRTTVGAATARLCGPCADLIGDGPRRPIVLVADTLPLLADADAAAYLAAQAWTPAKTVPEYPHEYVLLPRSADLLTHLRVVRFIRHHGDRRQWMPGDGPAAGRKVWCHYWRSGEHEHWTQPSLADPILNRKPAR
jgi:hypothetical protein